MQHLRLRLPGNRKHVAVPGTFRLVHSVMESNAFPLLLDLISEQIILDVKERLQTDQNNGKELLLSPELMAFSYTGALLR